MFIVCLFGFFIWGGKNSLDRSCASLSLSSFLSFFLSFFEFTAVCLLLFFLCFNPEADINAWARDTQKISGSRVNKRNRQTTKEPSESLSFHAAKHPSFHKLTEFAQKRTAACVGWFVLLAYVCLSLSFFLLSLPARLLLFSYKKVRSFCFLHDSRCNPKCKNVCVCVLQLHVFLVFSLSSSSSVSSFFSSADEKTKLCSPPYSHISVVLSPLSLPFSLLSQSRTKWPQETEANQERDHEGLNIGLIRFFCLSLFLPSFLPSFLPFFLSWLIVWVDLLIISSVYFFVFLGSWDWSDDWSLRVFSFA